VPPPLMDSTTYCSNSTNARLEPLSSTFNTRPLPGISAWPLTPAAGGNTSTIAPDGLRHVPYGGLGPPIRSTSSPTRGHVDAGPAMSIHLLDINDPCEGWRRLGGLRVQSHPSRLGASTRAGPEILEKSRATERSHCGLTYSIGSPEVGCLRRLLNQTECSPTF
jgi:hypothetical protein